MWTAKNNNSLSPLLQEKTNSMRMRREIKFFHVNFPNAEDWNGVLCL